MMLMQRSGISIISRLSLSLSYAIRLMRPLKARPFPGSAIFCSPTRESTPPTSAHLSYSAHTIRRGPEALRPFNHSFTCLSPTIGPPSKPPVIHIRDMAHTALAYRRHHSPHPRRRGKLASEHGVGRMASGCANSVYPFPVRSSLQLIAAPSVFQGACDTRLIHMVV